MTVLDRFQERLVEVLEHATVIEKARILRCVPVSLALSKPITIQTVHLVDIKGINLN